MGIGIYILISDLPYSWPDWIAFTSWQRRPDAGGGYWRCSSAVGCTWTWMFLNEIVWSSDQEVDFRYFWSFCSPTRALLPRTELIRHLRMSCEASDSCNKQGRTANAITLTPRHWLHWAMLHCGFTSAVTCAKGYMQNPGCWGQKVVFQSSSNAFALGWVRNVP